MLSLRERFTEGDCHILALAIHKATGWGFATFAYTCAGGEFPDLHAFVVMPDGRCLDIDGVCTQSELLVRWECSGHIHVWDLDTVTDEDPLCDWISEVRWLSSPEIATKVARRLLWHGAATCD